ncbi:rhodanese-like domain-containing protein [Undibacterium sp. SXout7W]|uniref:rhodanese-like domain-containing protein n=1 Tax=Undibacterium sp. SXout7W TaxID=3413049 RepID=UPI003BF04029
MTDLIFATPASPASSISSAQASDTSQSAAAHPILQQARQRALEAQLPFAGSITPPDAWQLIADGLATLVDVRTNEERVFVGYVPDSLHVAWMTGTAMNRNPRFAKELEGKVKDKSTVILFLCRSGKRSAAAAEAAQKAGFINSFNITEGFEGDLNPSQQRGHLGGWRVHALPWIQD